MSLKLVTNKSHYCKFQGERYARDIREENKELKDIENLKRLLHKRYNELLYTEILLTKREENLRKEKKHKSIENTYNEFIESLKRMRENKEKK